MKFREWLAEPFHWFAAGAETTINFASHPYLWRCTLSVLLGTALGFGANRVWPSGTPSVSMPASVEARPGQLFQIQAIIDGGEIDWFTDAADAEMVTFPGVNVVACRFPSVGTWRVHARTAKGSKIARAHTAVVVHDPTPPTPPVPPVPPTPPDPPQPPAPIPVAGLRVLIVLNTADIASLPKEQANALTANDVRAYLNSKCAMGPDGKTREWRIWDVTVDPSNESALWQSAFKRPRGAPPTILISNGKTGFEGPLPADTASLLTLLKKYGDN